MEIETKEIKHILVVNYDLYPKPGAVGNKWCDHTACFIFAGNYLKCEESANDKLREISKNANVCKINSWNLFSNEMEKEIEIINCE